MIKRELIEALEALDVDDDTKVYLMGYPVLGMCISSSEEYIDLQDYDTDI